MCNGLKVIPTRFREIVGLRSNVDQHLAGLPRARRRAIWSGIASLIKRGIFAAKSLLVPYLQLDTSQNVHSFGGLCQAGCITVVGYVDRKLTIYAVIDKVRLLMRAGEDRLCAVIDEFMDPAQTSRIRVLVAEYKFVVWSIWARIAGGPLQRRAAVVEMLPQRVQSIWQQEEYKILRA